MRKLRCTAPLVLFGLVVACEEAPQGEQSEAGAESHTVVAVAAIKGAAGENHGTVQLVKEQDQLALSVDLGTLSPGVSGFHLHEFGDCTGPDFRSAGGHLNPEGKQHGRDNPLGSHLGDLPNLETTSDGTASAKVPLAGEMEELLGALLDADGSAVVVHAERDDYKTDPTGNAGARIACGALIPFEN